MPWATDTSADRPRYDRPWWLSRFNIAMGVLLLLAVAALACSCLYPICFYLNATKQTVPDPAATAE